MVARAAIGLPLWLSVVAYVVNPKWLGWSALSLPTWLRWTGTVLAILAVPGVFWTLRALGTNVSETFLTKPGQTLVTDGPYRWIRHPLYTTAVGLFLGLGLMADSWFILLFAILALALVRWVVIPLEERELLAKFGDEYRRMRSRVSSPAWQRLETVPLDKLQRQLFSTFGGPTMLRPLTVFVILLVLVSGNLTGQDLQVAELGECCLESGEVIQECRLGYRTVGTIAADSDNVVLFPTWFGGTSEQILGLLGPDGMIDTSEFFVVVVDAFGNGVSSSPSNSAAQSGAAFPRITIRDMVRNQHRLLRERLGINHLEAVVGISMGGMQAFEWAVSYPGFAEKIIPIVGSPRLAVYDIVLWETDLRILEWFLACRCQPPAAVRRGMYFLMGGPDYRSRVSPRDSLPGARASLEAASLTEDRAHDLGAQLHAMIDHDVSTPFDGSLDRAASRVQAEVLVVVGLVDHVVTPTPALEFARLLDAPTLEFGNDCGHQAPWCEVGSFNSSVRDFLRR